MAARLGAMTPTARLRAVEEDIAALRDLGVARLSPIRRKHVVRRLAQLAGVDEGAVQRAFQALPPNRRHDAAAAEPAPTRRAEPSSPAEHLVGLLLAAPDYRTRLADGETARLRSAAAAAGEALAELAEIALSAASLDTLDNPDARATGVAWSRYIERVTEDDAERVKKFFEECLAALSRLPSPPASAEPAGASSDQPSSSDDVFARINAIRTQGGNPTALASPGTND